MAKSSKITYQQLAQETGLSVATISRVFTGSSAVSDATRQQLFETLSRRGYDLNQFFIREKKGAGGIVIFNIPSFGNPFYGEIMSGAKTAAAQRGYQLLINEEHINDATLDNFLELLHTTAAAGLIVANHVPGPLLKRLAETVPLVQCCEYDPAGDLPYVSIDDAAAAKNAMEYLFSLGRRTICFINGPIRYKYAKERLRGYQESLAAAGLQADPELIIQLPEISYNLAVSAVSALLNAARQGGMRQPDAFFCASDVLAAAVIKAASRADLSVPEDIMVIGFDNIDISAITSPTITTVNQPRYQMGVSACETLVERILTRSAPVRGILYDTELVVRESTLLGSFSDAKAQRRG